MGATGHRSWQLSEDWVQDDEVDGTGRRTEETVTVTRAKSRTSRVGGREPRAHADKADPGCGLGGGKWSLEVRTTDIT